MRDRTWGPRPEHRPRQAAYVTGAARRRSRLPRRHQHPARRRRPDRLRVPAPRRRHRRAGRRRAARRARPRARPRPARHDHATDVEGRPLRAVGEPVSRIDRQPPHVHRHQQPRCAGTSTAPRAGARTRTCGRCTRSPRRGAPEGSRRDAVNPPHRDPELADGRPAAVSQDQVPSLSRSRRRRTRSAGSGGGHRSTRPGRSPPFGSTLFSTPLTCGCVMTPHSAQFSHRL